LYPESNPHFIRHVPKPLRLDQQKAREQLKIVSDRFVVGVFGYVASSKRVEKVIAAFRELQQTHPNSQLVIVGPFHDEGYINELRPLVAQLGDFVTLTGFVDPPTYNAYLAACDVVVGLRWPWTGERSRVLNQAVGAGKPVIITDIPKWNDYPSEFTWRAPLDENEVPIIAEALIRLANHPDLLKAASAAALRWFDTEDLFSAMVMGYRKLIDSLIDN
ncbi:MAG: glycosyltransferase family 4 protein, partial [Anaerolineae bacterium]